MFFVLANSRRDVLAQYTISTRGGSRGQQLVIIFPGEVLFQEHLEGTLCMCDTATFQTWQTILTYR